MFYELCQVLNWSDTVYGMTTKLTLFGMKANRSNLFLDKSPEWNILSQTNKKTCLYLFLNDE